MQTETRQFFDAIFALLAQGVQSFSDGVQFTDAFDFTDEALMIPTAITGLKDNFKPEAAAAIPEDVDDYFMTKRSELIAAGLEETTAAAIESHVKGIYFSISAGIKNAEQEGA